MTFSRRLPGDNLHQHLGRGAPHIHGRLPNSRERRMRHRTNRNIVTAYDRDILRHPKPLFAARPKRSDGRHRVPGEQGGRPRRTTEHDVCRYPACLLRMPCLHYELRPNRLTVFSECQLIPCTPLDSAAYPRRTREMRDVSVAQAEQMIDSLPCAGRIVRIYCAAKLAVHGRPANDDSRQPILRRKKCQIVSDVRPEYDQAVHSSVEESCGLL